MGFGLQLFVLFVSVNFLAEASTGDADYETELLRQYLLNRVPERLLELQLQERQRPLFTYRFPEPRPEETFAVPPSDPRYYYRPPSDRQDTFVRASKFNRENEPVVRRPYIEEAEAEADNQLPANSKTNVNNAGEPKRAESESLADRAGYRGAAPHQQGMEVGGHHAHHDVTRMPTSMPMVQIIKTPVGDFQATREDMIFMATVAGCSAAAVVIIAIIGFGWYRLHRRVKAAADVDYPAYGVTGPNKEISPTGDRKLAENAQMYHYQHQKQQIISMSNSRVSNCEQGRGSGSEAESDEENEEGDYTVYECPGLAATGEMEVKNPLFQDDPTPAGGPDPVTHSQPVITPPQK